MTLDQVLVSEADHRIKNSLQLVASLLQKEARASHARPAGEVLADTYGRIMAVARLHDFLSRRLDSELIVLDDYLAALCDELGSALADPERHTILVNVDGVVVPSEVAGTLGMIVNELVTNELKHASPADCTIVSVECGLNAHGDLVLEVGNAGGLCAGGTPGSGTEGLGLGLVKTLTRQIGGRFECKVRPERQCQRITVPRQATRIERLSA